MTRFPWLVIAWFFALSPAAAADGLGPEQFEILKEVRGGYRLVTEEQHRRFWALFTDGDREEWIDAEQSGASKSILFSRMEEWAFWRSMYESQRAGKTIKIPELQQARSVRLALAMDETAKQSLLDEFSKEDGLLDPAGLISPDFRWHDPSLLFMKANNLEVLGRRMQLILDSEWRPAARQWSYPPMRLSISWAYPWWLNPVGMFCRAPCKTWSVSQTVTETGILSIFLFGEVTSGWDPSRVDTRAGVVQAGDVFYRFDVISQTCQQADWQGYGSTVCHSLIQGHDGKRSHRVTRIVHDSRRAVVWLLVAVSYDSEAEARRLYEHLNNVVTLE